MRTARSPACCGASADEGPDRLVGDELEAIDKQRGGEEPAAQISNCARGRGAARLRALCRERRHHCTQRRK